MVDLSQISMSDKAVQSALPVIEWGLQHGLFFDLYSIQEQFGTDAHEASRIIEYIGRRGSIATEKRRKRVFDRSGRCRHIVELRILGIKMPRVDKNKREGMNSILTRKLMNYRGYLEAKPKTKK